MRVCTESPNALGSSSNLYAAAARAATAVREALRLNARNIIQHHLTRPTKTSQQVVSFMQRPGSEVVEEMHTFLSNHIFLRDGLNIPCEEQAQVAKDLIAYVEKEHLFSNGDSLMPGSHLGLSVNEYKGFTLDRLLAKTIFDRRSNMADRLVTVLGNTREPSSDEADQAYALGQNFAKAGIIVLCLHTQGIMHPLLKGLKEQSGMSVGILRDTQVHMSRDQIIDETGLIDLPLVTPFSRFLGGENAERYVMAAMSGRTLVVLNGDYSPELHRGLKAAAYWGVPAVHYNTTVLPVGRHPLHTSQALDEVFEAVMENLCLPGALDANHHLRQHTPVSILAGTGYSSCEAEPHVSKDFVAEFAQLLPQSDFFAITGAGPGPMADLALAIHPYGLTMGFTFFPTYLATNGGIDLPIVSNKKQERSDLMALSSVLTVNLGGAHATEDEIIAARVYDRDIVNCCPQEFDSAHFRKFHGGRGSAVIMDAQTPAEAIAAMNTILGH